MLQGRLNLQPAGGIYTGGMGGILCWPVLYPNPFLDGGDSSSLDQNMRTIGLTRFGTEFDKVALI